jgi:hypothetical protein
MQNYQQFSSLVFTSWYGILNLYIWILAFAFYPQKDDDEVTVNDNDMDFLLANGDEGGSNQSFIYQHRKDLKSTVDRYMLPAIQLRS